MHRGAEPDGEHSNNIATAAFMKPNKGSSSWLFAKQWVASGLLKTKPVARQGRI